jgi:hypothetical protein
MFTKYELQLKEDLRNILSPNDKPDNDVDEVAKQVMYCLQPAVRSDITVFNLNSDDDLSATICRCICRCKLINFEYLFFSILNLFQHVKNYQKEKKSNERMKLK